MKPRENFYLKEGIIPTYEDQKNACCDKYSSAYMYGNFQ